MFFTNAFLGMALASALCIAPPAPPAAPAAPAQPAPAVTAPKAAEADDALTVKIWTCADHPQLRMSEKGACPICGKDMVQKEISLSGPTSAGDPYTLDTCPVSGMPLGKMGPAVVMVQDGREVRFCCKDCIAKFQAEPSKYLQQIDEKVIKQQLAHYPMTTCPVSGEPLGETGEPVNLVYNNQLVRFCCKMCVRKFKSTPAEFLSQLDAAVVAQQKSSYPLATCMVSGQKLGGMGEPVDYVVAGHLVRFCCPACIAGFYKSPAEYLAKLDKAWADKGGPAHPAAPAKQPAGSGGH